MQITRDPTAPFEAIVYIMNWALKDERLCITGSPAPSDTAAAAPTPATPAPVAAPAPAATDNKSKPKGGKLGPTPVKAKSATGAGCLVPQISGHDETNISNIKGERLVIGTNAMLPNLAPLKIEPFGPFRPTGFSAVPVPAVKGAATPVSGPSATTAKGRI